MNRWIDFRQDLHRHPELATCEHRTAQVVADQLRQLGLAVQCGVAGTGVVAELRGDRPGPVLAYRADMDALPIEEANDVPYKSNTPGVMHACGHDVHTAIALGLAEALAGRRNEVRGTVRFLFQPAEEGAPGDAVIGAEKMAQEGVLEGVSACFALHCLPGLAVGTLAHTNGPVWAGSDRFEALVRGRGTHAAYPHTGVDPIWVASHLVSALLTIPARLADARDALIVSVGSLQAGNTYNVIPTEARLEGIVRSLDDSVRAAAKAAMQQMITTLPQAFGATGEVAFHPGACLTANDPALENTCVQLLRQHVGAAAVPLIKPQLGAEDFSAFSRRVPSCYLFLGIGRESALHTPTFDVDEACIPFAIKAISDLLLRLPPL